MLPDGGQQFETARSGIRISSSTRSYISLRMRLSASLPENASSTRYPRRLSERRMLLATTGSSSTTNTFRPVALFGFQRPVIAMSHVGPASFTFAGRSSL